MPRKATDRSAAARSQTNEPGLLIVYGPGRDITSVTGVYLHVHVC